MENHEPARLDIRVLYALLARPSPSVFVPIAQAHRDYAVTRGTWRDYSALCLPAVAAKREGWVHRSRRPLSSADRFTIAGDDKGGR